jgi:hypothetical protein
MLQIIQPNCVDSETKKWERVGKVSNFWRSGKVRVLGAIIEDDQVILVTRDTQNRGGPEVTVYEVKGLNGSRKGARKGQPDVLIKLAGIVQGIISTRRAGDSWVTRQLG